MMNIDKALEHFKWKLQNSWKPTKSDLEAYNAIIDFKQLQEQEVLTRNESLAKLWIEKLILLNRSKMYDAKRSIQVIDEILDKPLYDLCLVLKNEIPMMRFNSVGSSKYPIEEKDSLNTLKMIERNEKIVAEFETELTEALKYEISEENIIKFVEQQINRIINKYEK